MNLASKSISPNSYSYDDNKGLTYREWLVGMLASNPECHIVRDSECKPVPLNLSDVAETIINQADEIIKQLEAEK